MVARVGLVPNTVLVAEFTALEHLAPGRVIAGLGTGDRLGTPENLAYGVPYPRVSERRAAMVDVAEALIGRGIEVWLAGGPTGRPDETRAAGAVLTLWDVEPELMRRTRPSGIRSRSPGPAPPPRTLAGSLAALARAGASWAVAAWPVDVSELARAGRAASAETARKPRT